MSFSEVLLEWHSGIDRNLPWKATRDAYKIWLSEIILQQTRVAQGIPYYNKFIQKYPTINDLAAADLHEVLKLWEGLGYYSRARNMHTAANTIVHDFEGIFPKDYSALLKIKGIGKYTAAAIASFAFNMPLAVVDGNVYRVLARYYGIDTPIDTAQGQQIFSDLAQQLLPPSDTAKYNQAIMDFGAIQCVPKSPKCTTCPLEASCRAYAVKKVSSFPVKEKRLTRRDRYFYYMIIISSGKIFLRQRKNKDIWHLLYEFPYKEYASSIDEASVEKDFYCLFMEKISSMHLCITNSVQMLTHQNIHASFSLITLKDCYAIDFEGVWVDISTVGNYAYPKIVKDFLDKNFYELIK